MKLRVIASAVILLLALSTLSLAQDSTIKAATAAAEHWLATVDAGQYATSWTDAAQSFQSKVTRQQWEQQLDQSRKPLGKMESRQFKSGLPATNPPGAPAGKYCIVQFKTKFANGGTLVETVSMQDRGGKWQTAGYFIKPE
jgi:uncharacterized protein DUF4019